MQMPQPEIPPTESAEPAGTARIAGLVLAAGAGTRYGLPKALVRDSAGRSWLRNAVDVLTASGCSPVIVVLGARGAEAAALLEAGENGPSASVLVVQAADWADGLSASLRAGLRCALAQPGVETIAIIPVDVPDLNAATVSRVIGARVIGTRMIGAITASTLRQARFAGKPGHPVVIGRAHWAALIETAAGDTGAGAYLRAHEVEAVECGDLSSGRDVDTAPAR
ncbi:nucleotidyltransferase family protein [Cryobacterium sp. PH31-O1]|uniref:nucleotidyltransferase family protein n=1 Tax=Cryobacterium sp. PH31-O1 TaxID=3046306 RepID=UPI0024BB66C8|nr:nucleotidyltransferase family protein [Cryobacterium sp. PH31-O1]MDJ0338916.1 nucleotidyltransferase family protein [Cryobacterium sp. PH31-O1]